MEACAALARPSFVPHGLFPALDGGDPPLSSTAERPALSLTAPNAAPGRRVSYRDLSPAERQALLEYIERDDDPSRWSYGECLQLHFVLLGELRKLRYTKTPLDEIIDLLSWVLSDREEAPFSFAQCLAVARQYPDAWKDDSFDGLGALDVDAARTAIIDRVRPVLRRKLLGLPGWVVKALREEFPYIASKLDEEPQWLNVQMAAKRHVDSVLASVDCPAWLREYVDTHPEYEREPFHADLTWLSAEISIREELARVQKRTDVSAWLKEKLERDAQDVRTRMHERRDWLERQCDLDRRLEEALRDPRCPPNVRSAALCHREGAMAKLERDPNWIERQSVQRSLF